MLDGMVKVLSSLEPARGLSKPVRALRRRTFGVASCYSVLGPPASDFIVKWSISLCNPLALRRRGTSVFFAPFDRRVSCSASCHGRNQLP